MTQADILVVGEPKPFWEFWPALTKATEVGIDRCEYVPWSDEIALYEAIEAIQPLLIVCLEERAVPAILTPPWEVGMPNPACVAGWHCLCLPCTDIAHLGNCYEPYWRARLEADVRIVELAATC